MTVENRLSASKRRTRAEVQQLVAEFMSSGMRQSEFCQSRGLSFSTLDHHLKKRRWKRRGRPTSSTGRLVPVELAARKSPKRHEPSCEMAVVLQGGRRIEVHPDFDTSTFERLVGIMERNWSTVVIGFDGKLLVIFILIAAFLAHGQQRQSLSKADMSSTLPAELKLGKPIQVELSGGQSHFYMIALEAGQYMRVVVSTPVPLAMRLSSIDGKKTLLSLIPQGFGSSRPICWIAQASAKYRLELVGLTETMAPQVINVELAALRPAVPEDRKRIAAQELLNQAGAMLSISERNNPEGARLLERALALSRGAKDREREATELSILGSAYPTMGRFEEAIDVSKQALAIWREIKDRQGESNALLSLGFAYSNLKQYEAEIDSVEQALSIKREIRDDRGGAFLLDILGNAYYSVKKYEKAIAYFDQALAIERTTGDRKTEASTRGMLGDAYFYLALNKYEEASGNYEQALALNREIGDEQGEAQALTGLGDVKWQLQQYEKAIDYYQQSLAIDGHLERTLVNAGLAYSSLGRFGEALTCLIKAEAIASTNKDNKNEMAALYGLGTVYFHLNEKERAVGFYQKSLAIAKESKNRKQEGAALSALGNVQLDLAQYVLSIGNHEQALAISREIKDRGGEATELGGLANVYCVLRQCDKAIGLYAQSLAISREISDRQAQGSTLANLGTAYRFMGQYEKAVNYYDQALEIARENKDRQGEKVIFTQMMETQLASGKPRLAIFYGKQAVNMVQSIRIDMRDVVPELKKSFLAENEAPYHTLADLLIAQGRLTEAEQVLNLLKEQEYFDFVRREQDDSTSANQRVDLTHDEAEWEKRYAAIGDKLVALGTEHSGLLAKKTLTPEESKRAAELDQDLAAGNAAFEKFLKDLAGHFSTVPDTTAKVEQLREAQGLMEDLRELPEGTVAIYTVVGKDKYRTILVTPDVQKAYEYPVKAVDLNHKILDFRQVLENPKLDPRPLAQELYKILVANMAEDLKQAKAKTVMWSLDGALRYLPVAALYDGKQYLVEQYALSVFTPASNARLKDRPDRDWTGAGFGVSKAHEGASALPDVAAELNGIIAPKSGQAILQGEVKLDDQFTEDTMRQTLLKHYPVVHIASHFRFEPGNETNSFLLLGDGTHLSLAELKTLPNLFGGVQLLTLSACNTGVGDTDSDGKEVEGLGVLAQRKGAKAVVASLWSVADMSTSLLMQEFYRDRASSGMTKVEALREAQLAMLRGTAKSSSTTVAHRELLHEEVSKGGTPGASAFPVDAKAPYAHPYYWAPFFLMGNWL